MYLYINVAPGTNVTMQCTAWADVDDMVCSPTATERGLHQDLRCSYSDIECKRSPDPGAAPTPGDIAAARNDLLRFLVTEGYELCDERRRRNTGSYNTRYGSEPVSGDMGKHDMSVDENVPPTAS